MAPRPGIEGAKALLKKPEEEWVLMEKSYRDMLKAKGGEELVSLQDEYIDKLISRFAAYKNLGTDDVHPIISKEEFISVMKWKFRKGKDRSNFLMKGLLSNNEENIQKALHQAIMHLQKYPSDLKGALKIVTTLNKVGPASASIFLSMIRPELCCFMDDEVMEVLSPSGKREYTLKSFFALAGRTQEIAENLGGNWSPYRVGRALWTAAMRHIYDRPADIENDRGDVPTVNIRGGKKRKRANV